MKKIFSILLVAVMVFSVTTAFADGIGWGDNTYTISTKVSPTSVSAGDDISVSVYVKNTTTNSEETYYEGGGSLWFFYEYNPEILTFKSASYQTGIPTTDMVVPTTATFGVEGKIKFVADFGSDFTVDTTEPVATYVFTVSSVATAKEYSALTEDTSSGATIGNLMGETAGTVVYADAAKFTVKGSEPATISPVANTTIAAGDVNYTDVVNFIGSTTGSGTKLSFDLFENGAKHGNTYSVNLADYTTGGITVDNGTVSFKVAVIGAPATGVTMGNITLGN